MKLTKRKTKEEIRFNNILNTLLSWFNRMAFDDLNKTYKECSKFEKIIMNIEKYYVKYKPLQVPMYEAQETTNKLIAIQKKYESLITI